VKDVGADKNSKVGRKTVDTQPTQSKKKPQKKTRKQLNSKKVDRKNSEK